MGYYLVDGIYPKWRTLIQGYRVPSNDKKSYFTEKVASYRKDIEHTFGVLQVRFHILTNPVRFHDARVLSKIVYVCIIIHNMIVESERGGYKNQKNNYPDMFKGSNTRPQRNTNSMEEYVSTVKHIEDQVAHFELREQLVNHLWVHRGRNARTT